DFLPLVEEVQLGQALFEWGLERACRQAQRWQAERTPRRVAVNISPQALERRDLAATVTAALRRRDRPPALRAIEVSERTALATLEANAVRLGELRAMGVRVALDDFGVAQASLQHLRELPLDGLKIDRTFVARLGEQAPGEDVDMLRAIIGIGRSLKLRVTAEGVETRAQNALLRSLRCDEAQGFLFSQPVPAECGPVVACAASSRGRQREPAGPGIIADAPRPRSGASRSYMPADTDAGAGAPANPLLTEGHRVPFDTIAVEHYVPAVRSALAWAREELEGLKSTGGELTYDAVL